MLTIFTIPKAFNQDPHIRTIQRNAIKSWIKLSPACEVILFGDEGGIAETAEEFNIRHIPEISKSEFGTPILGDVFNKAKAVAKYELICYLNCDVIVLGSFAKAVPKIQKEKFLLVGRRWDLDVDKEINFDDSEWEEKLKRKIKESGKMHSPSGSDYFVFQKNIFGNFPPLIVGSPGWDNWIIYKARSLKIPVIDATKEITIIHQNHKSPRRSTDSYKFEGQRNIKIAGGFSHFMTLRDADWTLTPNGLERSGSLLSKLSLFYPWRLILSLKRQLLP